MIRSLRARGAAAEAGRCAARRGLRAAAIAAWLAFAGLVAGAPPARAIEPDVVPDAMWWYEQSPRSMAQRPLASLRAATGGVLEAQWAPLYVGRDGARFEEARRSVRGIARVRALSVGLELSAREAAAHGGGEEWWIGARSARRQWGTLGALVALPRASAGGALTVADGRVGGALELAASPRAGVTAECGWSSTPEQGRADVRWNPVEVEPLGTWRDDRVRCRLEGVDARRNAWLELASLDRRGARATTNADAFAPRLSWRSAGAGFGVALGRTHLDARLEHGEGREGLSVERDRTRYANASGPIRSTLLVAGVRRGAWDARAWSGRWSGDLAGDLALWPFDDFAGLAGTRRLARSSAALSHAGVALDVARGSGRAMDGGLALWHVRPSASYETWQATILGIGRDDVSSGETTLRSAWLAGARVAVTARLGLASARVEVVQWVPVAADRVHAAPGGSGGGSGAGPGAARSVERGGTILRLSLVAAN